MKAITFPTITVSQLARECGKTAGRIRQICNQNGIGILVGGRVRVLSDDDVIRVKSILSHDRRKNSEKPVDSLLSRR